ncbi:MAG TPA: M2 family metallopeptidase [Flavobacteriales bacterium]|nr:peptidase [Flavobacteriales bacterium]HRE74244.1 M2 family metallopeptidase [Flavobacteriales bacterium]HRE95754.1 M2 family metallopeptidase [Flavobacteriales bacterium]HRJ35501.1 M2 family metallopeptidase [Flavobacteriales bacterium]HRJ38734.1 M2 family metallopeptidase [Flavobacteriales bacterium]
MFRKLLSVSLLSFVLFACGGNKTASENPEQNNQSEIQKEVQIYLDEYNQKFQELLYAQNEAQWAMLTRIVPGDTTASHNAGLADEAMSKFTGSKANTDKAQNYLTKKSELSEIQVRQLDYILFLAGGSPEAAGDIVKERIKAQNEQSEKLYSFNLTIDGKKVSTNDIDAILKTENNVAKRLKAWSASKEVGKGLKAGLVKLQDLRNRSVQALGYSDYFSYQVSEYGMSSEELRGVCQDMIRELWPLYRELHTWARYELAARYKQPVPEMLPAHWVPNRWGQDWSGMINVEGFDVEGALEKKSAEWIMQEGEAFYVSLGFESLPKSFHEKSSLYPLPKDANYSKNNHASAWHMNNDRDVRSLMSVEANSEWWETVLHELGHIYYFLEYSNPDVPIILRNGANRAYHEAFGTMIGLASMQKSFLQGRGLIDTNAESDPTQVLLREALSYVVVIPWAAGVMTDFEYELYSKNLPADQYNKRWWELVGKYQGIVPPTTRGEEYCDAATKTHISDDPAQYYDYAMSNILLFQFHEHIATKILKQDPHNTNYWGNKEVGNFMKELMRPGASVDWKDHLKKNIGSEMSAKAMVNYFSPLMDYLKKVNEGRTCTLPETI